MLATEASNELPSLTWAPGEQIIYQTDNNTNLATRETTAGSKTKDPGFPTLTKQ